MPSLCVNAIDWGGMCIQLLDEVHERRLIIIGQFSRLPQRSIHMLLC